MMSDGSVTRYPVPKGLSSSDRGKNPAWGGVGWEPQPSRDTDGVRVTLEPVTIRFRTARS